MAKSSTVIIIPIIFNFLALLTFCFIFTQVIGAADVVGKVYIQSALPKLSEQVSIKCGSVFPPKKLSVGEQYIWRVKSSEVSEGQIRCFALWPPRNYLLWEAYEPSSDHHGYWSVKEDGFYYSKNKTRWEKKASWYHE